MKPFAKTLWIEALRSGKYRQGKGTLRQRVRNGEGYLMPDVVEHCCLGVLCEIAFEQGIVQRDENFDNEGRTRYFSPSEMDASSDFLPQVVKKWAGLSDSNGGMVEIIWGDLPLTSSLIGLNDDRGYTFNDIAAIIEEQL